jgi:hypothetical protein
MIHRVMMNLLAFPLHQSYYLTLLSVDSVQSLSGLWFRSLHRSCYLYKNPPRLELIFQIG